MPSVTFTVPTRQMPKINPSFTPHQPPHFDIEVRTVEHDRLQHLDLPNQHPISAITGLTEALATFIHEQGVASPVWNVEHNLNKYPAVSVVDSAGNEIIAEVTYLDLNNITITMTSAFKGKAFLN